MQSKFWFGKQVVITGLNGFKGSWLALTLRLMGAEVIGLGINPNWGPTIYDYYDGQIGKITNKLIDIRNQADLLKELQKIRPEIIFHLAAQPLVLDSYDRPIETIEANVLGTAFLLEAVRKLKTKPKVLINVTSDKVYENDGLACSFRENDLLGGKDVYSASKACSEILTKAYKASFLADVRVCTARAGNVIGGGDWSKNRIIPDIFIALKRGNPPLIRNPQATRPWQHVLEPISGYIRLAEKVYGKPFFEGAWNFGPILDRPYTVEDVYIEFNKIWDGPTSKTPKSIKTKSKKIESAFLQVDSTKARAVLGWQSKLSFEEAISYTAVWYKLFAAEQKKDILISKTIEQIKSFYTK